MSTQRTDSVELDIAIAADSSAPSASLAASIPPELFKNVLAYVGDEDLLENRDIFNTTSPKHVSAVAARRDEMKHLSACASTCVYWAQLTRERMFQTLILRSSKDMSSFLSLLRALQSPRIPPICDILQYLYVFYTLGDHPWFHNLAGLIANHQLSRFLGGCLYITGPATSAFVAASTQGSMLHPLFFATPRVLPIMFPKRCDLHLFIVNIHLPNPTVLSNLLQDCLSLLPLTVVCTNLTWDVDPVLQATPSSIGLKYACRTSNRRSHGVSGCTDNVLVATMLKSVPCHGFSQQHQGPYLSPLETSFLFDIMRSRPSSEHRRTGRFSIWSYSGLDNYQEHVAVRLPAGTDFCLEWRLDPFVFRCMASRLPHDPATSNNIRFVTYITIDLMYFDNHYMLRGRMETANIDWDTFLHTVRQFPHLRQIAIQCDGYTMGLPSTRQILVEFLAHLGEAWFGLRELLGLYYREEDESEWVQLRLDTLMDEIEQRREEIKAEADAEEDTSSELESSSRRRRGGIE